MYCIKDNEMSGVHMIYRIDDVMYVGPYFYKMNSKATNTFKLKKKGGVFEKYQEEFNNMWLKGK